MAASGGLLERQRELSAIAAAIEAAGRSEGGALAIEGEAGLGKTSLMVEARQDAEEAGLWVLSGRGTELERDFPFAIARQLLEPRLGLLSAAEREALFEGAGAARGALGIGPDDGSTPDTFSVLHALYWVVAGLAERRPLLLAVDDAHLADPASLDWLTFLLPRLEELPVLLLLARRTGEEENPGLARILGDSSVEQLVPAPLSPAATEALIEATLGKPLDSGFATACHEVTRGNPFLVKQLGRELAAQGIAPEPGGVDLVHTLAPERVAQMVLARIALLPIEAAALARSLAVLGDDSEQTLVAELAGLEPEVGSRAADALRRASVLDAAERLQFSHPLVRNAIYADLATGERARAHAEAATLLQKRGAAPERVATQLLVSEARGDRNAVEVLLRAGQQALDDGAPRSAVAYLSRALREPPPDELRVDVVGNLLSAAIRSVDYEALAAAVPEMLRELKRDHAANRRWAIPLTMAMALCGRFEEAADFLKAAAETAAGEGDVQSAFQMEAQLRTIAVILPSPPQVDLQPYIDEIPPDSPAGRLAAAIEARAAVMNGGAPEAIAAAKRALGDGAVIFEEEPEIAAALMAVLTLVAADAIDAAGAAADRALKIAHRRNSSTELGRGYFMRGLVALGRGDLVAAEADLRQASDLARLAGVVPLVMMFNGALGEVLIERDELEAAEGILREAGVADGPVPANGMFALLGIVRVHLRFERGEPTGAAEDHAALIAQGESLGFGPGPIVMASPYGVHALIAAGRAEEAASLAESALFFGRRWGAPGTVSHTLRAAAPTRSGAGEIEALEEAVSVVDGTPRRLQRAHALVDLGASLRRQNQRARAREPLREGLKLARQCGAVRLAKRAQQELQATGETVRRYAPIGVESLTPSERRVAELAASGMTNRQIAQSLFVTVKTVEAHLSASYDKLDISSRRQLADALAR